MCVTKEQELEQIRNEIIAVFGERKQDTPGCDEQFWEYVEEMEANGDADGDKLRVLGIEYDAV